MNASEPIIERQATLADQVAGILRDRIVRGDYPFGMRLVEAEIARRLGVSRAPVREAISVLIAEGLVRDVPRKGAFVADLTARDIAEIHDLRAAIEGHAARICIARDGRTAFTGLAPQLEEMRHAAAEDDRKAYARAVMDFHRELTRRAGNGRLFQTWVNLAALLGAILQVEVESQEESLVSLLAEHEELVVAIESGDAERAYAGCELHMDRATARLVRVRERAGHGELVAVGPDR